VPRRDLRPNTPAYLFGKALFAILFHTYVPMTVEGEENVPSDGPLIMISNHASNLDPFALGFACHREVNFLGKQELFRIPVVSYLIRQWGTIPLDRGSADASAVRAALGVLRQGKVLALFPEGTRSTTGELQRFREGAAKLALRLALPVVPAAIAGTHAVLPPGARFPRPRRVRVRFGAPFHLATGPEMRPSPADLAAAAELLRSHVAGLLAAPEPGEGD
jgi:1-acyl-sn-glycerol-3-phosphate acyltransferase